MKPIKINTLLLLAMLCFDFSFSQEINLPKKPMTSVEIAAFYISQTVITAAEKMPEEYYKFRPTSEVRNFGELLMHIVESNFEMASIAKGEPTPESEFVHAESKAEIIEVLKKSFEYLTEARENMTKDRKDTIP